MTEAVTDIIVARSSGPEGLKAMLVWSAVAHVFVIGVMLFVRSNAEEAPRAVMTISLGGAPGPRAGGLTQLGGRSVPTPTPDPPVRRQETAPSPSVPAMALPDPEAKPRPRQERRQAPAAPARPAPSAEPPQEGSTRTETGARGQGFGLSSGGSGTRGVELDVANFCCPEYLEQMVSLIQRNWDQNQILAGSTVMKFTVGRDGTFRDITVERSSGLLALDNAANRAVARTERVPPLPALFPNPTLTVHMRFEYQR